jgi:hypothetical protein
MKAAIYTSGGNLMGTVGTQLVQLTSLTDDQFVLFTYADGTEPTLAANTQYVIVVWAENHGSWQNPESAYLYGSSNSGTGRYEDKDWSNADGIFPSSVGSWQGSDTINYSIYCTYSIP